MNSYIESKLGIKQQLANGHRQCLDSFAENLGPVLVGKVSGRQSLW